MNLKRKWGVKEVMEEREVGMMQLYFNLKN